MNSKVSIDTMKQNDNNIESTLRPLYQSYCGHNGIFAGEYPGDRSEDIARQRVEQMYNFGIRYFIDLTEDGELCPYAHLLPEDATHIRFAICDRKTPTDFEGVERLIERIDALREQGGKIYIHCWGGVGRTGLIMACYIATHMENPTKTSVLAALRAYFSAMPKSSYRTTPDCRCQVQYITSFISHWISKNE